MSDEFARISASYEYLLHRYRAGEERRRLGEKLTRRMIGPLDLAARSLP